MDHATASQTWPFRSLPDHFFLFLFIYSQTKTWIMSHRRLPDHFWTFRSLPDHFWPFKSLPDHLPVYLLPDHFCSQTISYYFCLFTPRPKRGSCRSFPDHFWPFKSLPDHFWLFETSQTISGFKSLPDNFCPFRQLNNTKNKFISYKHRFGFC